MLFLKMFWNNVAGIFRNKQWKQFKFAMEFEKIQDAMDYKSCLNTGLLSVLNYEALMLHIF